MKIAILGTRGIPNNYGGFEQFAEYLSLGLLAKGHEVYVYNSHSHPYKGKDFKGVKLIHKYDPENLIGTAGQFIYDLNCILDSRKRNFDIVFQLGYTSSSIWSVFLPKKSIIVTNMDGLEWKRSKYSEKVQKFLRFAEKKAVHTSDYLVADSIGIKTYLKETYNVHSEYIPYGANIFTNPLFHLLDQIRVEKFGYDMLIARMEPENSIEIILDGYVKSQQKRPFLVVGNVKTKFGLYLKEKYKNETGVRFLGAIYDLELLNNLRYFSNLYFHGHTVGGTNPSLLEAMGSHALVCAHENVFNKTILQEDAFYFNSSEEVANALNSFLKAPDHAFVTANLLKIKGFFNWENVITQYNSFFTKIKG